MRVIGAITTKYSKFKCLSIIKLKIYKKNYSILDWRHFNTIHIQYEVLHNYWTECELTS